MSEPLDVLLVRRDGAAVVVTIGGARDGAAIELDGAGWSHAAWLDADTVLFASPARDEALVVRLAGERAEPVGRLAPPIAWTHLTAIGDRRVLWTDAATGRGCVTRVDGGGAIAARGPALSIGAPYTHVVGGARGDVVLAHAEGTAIAGVIDAGGALQLAAAPVELPGGFDVAIDCGAAALFYRDGTAQLAALTGGRLGAPRPFAIDASDTHAIALVRAIERGADTIALAVRPY